MTNIDVHPVRIIFDFLFNSTVVDIISVPVVYRIFYGNIPSPLSLRFPFSLLVSDLVVPVVNNRSRKIALPTIKIFRKKSRISKSIVRIKTKVVIGMESFEIFPHIWKHVDLFLSIVPMDVESNSNNVLQINIRKMIVPNE